MKKDDLMASQTGSSTGLETSLSRHLGVQVRAPPETPETSRPYSDEGFKEDSNWAPNTPRGVSLSGSWCKFFHSG